MRAPMLETSLIAAAVAGLLGAGFLLATTARGTSGSEQGFLASLVSRALSTPATQVHIGGVDGALSSDATIRDVVISDRDGPWLKLDRARLVWRRSALFLRRLEVDSLEIGHLEIIRKPLPSDTPVKGADQPLLPELPVKVEIKQFALANLDLGKALLGTALQASATGNTELGSPSEGLAFNLDAKRLDSPGSFAAGLTYVPQGKALRVNIALDEPAGGLSAKIGHLPGEPPVGFHLVGNGTLDAFKGDLDFHAGPTIEATGAITLARRDTDRDLAVRVGGHLGALLPAVAAPIFEGKSDLVSDVRIGDDSAVGLDDLTLTSHLARLDAHGTFGADKMMDFVANVRAVPNDGEVSKAGATTIRKLRFDAAVQGPVKAPKIVAKLALADASLPEGSLATLDASFTATPSGEVTDAATRVALEGAVDAKGLVPRDATLATAIGGSATLALHGSVDTQGNATFQRIEARTPTLVVAYAGDLAQANVHGRLSGEAPDLSRFGELAGLRLTGEAALGVDLDGTPKLGTLKAAVTANLTGFATGLTAVDQLAGRHVAASGKIALVDGRATIEDLTLDGAHVAARVAGTAAPKAADLTAHVALADLAQADPRLTGAGAFDAHLTGDLVSPDISLAATLDRATAMGRPIPHLALLATIADPRGAASTRVTLDGTVDRKPAKGLLVLARQRGGWTLPTLDVAIGSIALKGTGTVDAQHLAQGSIALSAGNLDDLSPLVLTKLGGSLLLDAAFATPDDAQSVRLEGKGTDLRAAGAALRHFSLRAAATDVYRRPVLDADATIDQALVGGQTISAVTFSAKGQAAKSAVTLSAHAAGFDFDAAGALMPGAVTHFDLASFSARRGTKKIALAGPADLALIDGGVAIRHLALGIAGGRLAIDGHAGRTLDLTIDARAIPLAAADIAVPGLGLGGTLEANARLSGPATAPIGPYHVTIKHLVAPQTKSAGVPAIDVAASGRLEGRRASLDAKVSAGRAGTVTATGSLPLDPAGAIDLAVRGKLDAAVANATLGPSGRTVTGSLVVDARLAGTSKAPRVSGGATMSGGTFRDALLGVRLDAIDARLAANGDRVSVERMSATTPNGGSLSASGEVKVDPAAGFPGKVTLRGHRAQLVASSLMTATADLAIDVSGALTRSPRIGGRVEVSRVDVAIPDRLPTTLKPIDGIVHVNAPAQVTERLALLGKKAGASKGSKGRAALFEAMLDVTVAAPSHIFVRGRGVNAELGGDLHVTGTTDKPVPIGAFDLRHGEISALGKVLTFSKGNLTFTGDLMPELDFAAEIQSNDITAQIAVTGPAAAPVFAFTSIPSLPQDEILSRVLFQKPSGSLSGFQALQLAQAAAQFSGGGGDDAFETMRKSLGLGSADVGDDSNSGGPLGSLSRAIGDRVNIGVRTGATADQTGLAADIDVTKHIRVQSDVRSNGATSAGVGTELEY